MMSRERVVAEVVWIASIGHFDCEGRSIQSREASDHDTEGDARRWLVARGLFERESRVFGKDWRDDSGYMTGSVVRTIREVVTPDAGGAT
jgi:hypothetical protein